MHVTFDVDGVLANFAKGFCGVLKDLYNIDLDPDACKSWYWADWADGLTKEMENEAWRVLMNDPKYADFWAELDSLCTPEDVERINDLADRHIISFVTNRSEKDQHRNVRMVTMSWLVGNGIHSWNNTYIAGHGQKGTIARGFGTHIAIEDNGDNVINYLDNGIAVAMLRRAYNEGYVELVRARGGYIVDTLPEFLDLLMRFDASQDDALQMSETTIMRNVLWHMPRPAEIVEATREPSTT